jgi:hypothetical protein
MSHFLFLLPPSSNNKMDPNLETPKNQSPSSTTDPIQHHHQYPPLKNKFGWALSPYALARSSTLELKHPPPDHISTDNSNGKVEYYYYYLSQMNKIFVHVSSTRYSFFFFFQD